MRALLISLFVVLFVGAAYADGSGSALPDAGSASAPAGSAAAAPADKLHDASSPAAAFDDLKAARKVGWSVAVFAFLVIAARGAAKLGGRFSFLGKGKAAVIVAAVGAIAVACYNAAASGGSWTAILSAAVAAGAHYFDAGKVA